MAKLSEKYLNRILNPEDENTERQKINYFSLKNDKESAEVTFLYKDLDDIAQFARVVHMFKLPNMQFPVKIDCLRKEGGSLSDCPLCEDEVRKSNRLFIPLYNHSTEQVELWERSISEYYPLIVEFMDEYKDLTKEVFTIKRHGKPGNTRTFFTVERSAETELDMEGHIESRPDLDVYGSPVWKWDEERMITSLERNPEQERYGDKKVEQAF